MNSATLENDFPIESQTSVADKMALLQVRRLLNDKLGNYAYLEIGSFMGGSLTPFLRDSRCTAILSIDERNRQQPDERGITFDYVGITHQSMIDNLRDHGFDLKKLKTFDGSINDYPAANEKFDLVFIDGEHTDLACFRDFIYSCRLLKKDSVIVFHDSTIIYKALRIIQEYLTEAQEEFRFIKIKDSEVSCIFRSSLSAVKFEAYFQCEEDLDGFYQDAEKTVTSQLLKNRLDVNITIKLKDTPVQKAY
jgi:predicted O-methyltransferase YrrM